MVSKILSLLICLGLSVVAAAVGGYWTSLSVGEWYPTLVKPSWNPPAWVFGPVWTILYAMMATAVWLIWISPQGQARKQSLMFYAAQLILNTAWSGSFFGLRNPGLGVLNIGLLLLLIGCCVERFWRVSRGASFLMMPYLLWVLFAAAVNIAIWRLNS